ncbi:mitochondrial GTPase 1 [Trichuris trichiura]|uniref:Mitochondrial GTPase 1 n=1 Tax=Trichuris trichiura TaxID=36087 RepID=A0A077Z153_TRITR|nr:mitochondrial GTPase 1 [Trichuris trichiura]
MAKGAVMGLRRHFVLPESFRLETWFPAHMFSGMKKMQAKLRSVDCIVEVHDARIPFTGRNRQFNRLLFKGKPNLLFLNKADLAGSLHRRQVAERLANNGEEGEVIFGSFKSSDKRKTCFALMHQLRRAIEGEMRFHREGLAEYNVMIVGIPNVGKSSLINALRECFTDLNVNACRVGRKPGITRSVTSRVRISDRPLIYMFDTPGVLTPEIYVNRRVHPESVLKLGLCECLPDERVGVELLADYLLYFCNRQDRSAYVSQLQLDDTCDDIDRVLRHLAEKEELKKRIVLYGNTETLLDTECAAKKFIQLFRRGHLGDQFLDVDALT